MGLRRGCVRSVRNFRLASWFNQVMHYFAMCLTLDGLTCRRTDGQLLEGYRESSVQGVVLVYVRTDRRTNNYSGKALSMNRLSVRTDGRMHGQLQWKASVQWIALEYVRTDEKTECYWSVLCTATQVRISGCSDTGWGIERQLRQIAMNLIYRGDKLIGKCFQS